MKISYLVIAVLAAVAVVAMAGDGTDDVKMS